MGEKEKAALNKAKKGLTELFKEIDRDASGEEGGDGRLSKSELKSFLRDGRVRDKLRAMEIDATTVEDLTSIIFEASRDQVVVDKWGDPTIPFLTFIEAITDFRGKKQIRIKDVVGIRRYISLGHERKLESLADFETKVTRRLRRLLKAAGLEEEDEAGSDLFESPDAFGASIRNIISARKAEADTPEDGKAVRFSQHEEPESEDAQWPH